MCYFLFWELKNLYYKKYIMFFSKIGLTEVYSCSMENVGDWKKWYKNLSENSDILSVYTFSLVRDSFSRNSRLKKFRKRWHALHNSTIKNFSEISSTLITLENDKRKRPVLGISSRYVVLRSAFLLLQLPTGWLTCCGCQIPCCSCIDPVRNSRRIIYELSRENNSRELLSRVVLRSTSFRRHPLITSASDRARRLPPSTIVSFAPAP